LGLDLVQDCADIAAREKKEKEKKMSNSEQRGRE
jgi:hypothetical protein